MRGDTGNLGTALAVATSPLYNKRTWKHQEVDSVHMDAGVGDELLGVIQVTSSVLADR